MCVGTNCPKKKQCYRYTATPTPLWQSWFVDVPYDTHKNECEYFYINPRKEIKDDNRQDSYNMEIR
tara:strand:+ start:10739 stop:10936 length:198 start_codon:yes stop_codon:yes gene_type:complete